MRIENIFNNANDEMNENYKLALQNEAFEIGKITELIAYYKNVSNPLEKDNLVNEIIYDLYTAIHLALSGLYRHSYISLRCALELGISLMRFKDNNYEYLLWKNNEEDIVWSNLVDNERGILSERYLKLFKEGSYKILIEKTKSYYRECSEYVHGKYKYINPLSNYKIQYNKNICHKVLIMCKDIVSVLSLLLNIRFNYVSQQYYELNEEIKKIYEV